MNATAADRLELARRRKVAAAISRAERGELYALSGLSTGTVAEPSHVIGITGAPGVGKSCLTGAVVHECRKQGRTVGVLAVDPSSPTMGGALLGDRLRLTAHVGDPSVYIRSLASRGHLGGTSRCTPLAVAVLEEAGFDTIIIETVGVGQSEFEITAIADTSVWCTAPQLGDGVQASKAGILEMVDLLVVNKADLPGAEIAAEQLRTSLLHRRSSDSVSWEPSVHLTVATNGTGVSRLVDALDRHRQQLARAEDIGGRRLTRVRHALSDAASSLMAERTSAATTAAGTSLLDHLATEVAALHCSFEKAARLLADSATTPSVGGREQPTG